ncbi:MAG: ATP-grasp domain-containing protein [Jaaginema sp. PMC 1079.18]|nr:ATP-grasp domain-containing protein [Jaaginema sp. PMC 1080.18]MEC4853114.1 ATP-grasp domain-containing protein [Jaaginema sp. PMC 1079.18]MEC4867948.1 ATP-grasp domain-containing protein [Jaaginema sp. PMC 1078.18]
MQILYPKHPIYPVQADEPYQEEYLYFKSAGINCVLFDYDALSYGEFKPKPPLENGQQVLYRGWMLNAESYHNLTQAVKKKRGCPVTNLETYLKCHYISGWYEVCRDFTPETYLFAVDEKLEENIAALGWEEFFVKDYVKSNTTAIGSIARSAQEAVKIVGLIKEFRGEVEGGVAIRRVESFTPGTEARYFVMRGKAYSRHGKELPEVVASVAKRIVSPFYSVDIAQTVKGDWRIVELGDGQVSDKKEWKTAEFCHILIENSQSLGLAEEPL